MDTPHLFAGDNLLQIQEKSLAFRVIKAVMMIPRANDLRCRDHDSI
jgi:hypothetical protein